MSVRKHETAHLRDVRNGDELDGGVEVKVPEDINFRSAAVVAMDHVMRWVKTHERLEKK